MRLFGFEFKKAQDIEDKAPSFTPKETDDGALVIAAGGSFGTYVDLDGTVRTEAELVTKYRDMATHPECDSAVDEIINEAISIDEEKIVDINLDSINFPDNIKKIIRTEFNECLRLLEFNKLAYDVFWRWYVDGRLYYHVIIDPKDPKNGIQEIRYIDPRKIRKVREIQRKRIKATDQATSDITVTKTVNEYYVYNDKGFNFGNKAMGPTTTTGLKISKDSILHVVSGRTDKDGTMVLSYLHKAIKALNQLRVLEDALVIYRLARAPERRIWYIDVGNLPKMKAEQYVRDIMVKHKNRLVYDAETGSVRDDRKFQTMLEDYWLPRREGGRGTEVTTLPGGQTLGQMDDVLYFQKKFLQCLNVPVSRLNSDALFSIGRATEITRDELKFARFIVRLRTRFSSLFQELLKKQLILKEIITLEDWNVLATQIKYNFSRDNYFTELKDAEMAESRINLARNFQDMAGKYYSHRWIRKNILRQSDEDVEQYDSEISMEMESGEARWFNPVIEQNNQLMQQPDQLVNDGQGGDQDSGQSSPQAMHSDTTHPGNAEGGDESRQKMEQVRQAQVTIDQMKKKKGNRTMQDESKYKAAVQIVAKNKDVLAKMGVSDTKNRSQWKKWHG
jgi:hypothetical protein